MCRTGAFTDSLQMQQLSILQRARCVTPRGHAYYRKVAASGTALLVATTAAPAAVIRRTRHNLCTDERIIATNYQFTNLLPLLYTYFMHNKLS